jgi:ubiquinone/menaquinone biosynthesis C-methylase UbiE
MGENDVRTDPGNAAQRADWDGPMGEFWVRWAARLDRAAAGYLPHLVAEVGAGDAVLDIGCGTGATTRAAARRGARATGVDLSASMLDLARRSAADEAVEGVEFVQGDAQVHPFSPESYDVAISRHGSMFFADPVAAFATIASALKPGGRLALITWQAQKRNEFRTAVHAALAGWRPLAEPPAHAPSPFSLSDPERVREVLGAAGFEDVALREVREPMCFGDTVDEAYEYLSAHFGPVTADYDEELKARAFAALHADVAAHLTGDGVLYGSAAWLVTARRGRGR